jgi:hypothetical protein
LQGRVTFLAAVARPFSAARAQVDYIPFEQSTKFTTRTPTFQMSRFDKRQLMRMQTTLK